MYSGRLVSSQLMDLLPMHQFRRCVNKQVPLQLSYENVLLLRPIPVYGLRSAFLWRASDILNHASVRCRIKGIMGEQEVGFPEAPQQMQMKKRNWRIYADFAHEKLTTPDCSEASSHSFKGILATPSAVLQPTESIADNGILATACKDCQPNTESRPIGSRIDARGCQQFFYILWFFERPDAAFRKAKHGLLLSENS